jgi:predicted dehydrogenase
MSEPIRLAFTGTGWAARVHARAAQAQSGVALAAVVNHRAESAAAFAEEFGIPRRYTSLADLLGEGGVDAVVVSTPNYLHAPQTIAALQAGLPVMVEKPMAMNAAEAEAMCAASRAAGSLLMVAHCWRFDPQAQWLRAQAAAGRLGRVVRTKGYGVHVNWGPAGWFTQAALAGGGAMADVGIHAVDTARYLLGDPRPASVYARIGTHYKDYDVDDTGVVIVTWEGGAVSYIESGWWQPHADGAFASTQLYGASGFGQLFPTHMKLMPPGATEPQQVESGLPAQAGPQARQAMYQAQLAHFIDCIRADRPPAADGEVGLVNMQIVEAAYASARGDTVVHLNR